MTKFQRTAATDLVPPTLAFARNLSLILRDHWLILGLQNYLPWGVSMSDSVDRDRFSFKYVKSIIGFVFMLYGANEKSTGDFLFGFILASCDVLEFILTNPAKTMLPYIIFIRKIFRSGDSLSRYSVIIMALGGSALILDRIFDINLIKTIPLDTLIKRIAPIIIINTIVIYVCIIVSKLIFDVSEVRLDNKSLKYEVLLYVSSLNFIIFNAFFWIGFNMEDKAIFGKIRPTDWNPGGWIDLHESIHKFFQAMTLISLIWFIGFLACCLSRYAEFYWKELFIIKKR
ncbi:MAG TPA: hypothetical protein VGV17_13605 [Bosea sp. (in: a-proteobacteria)]|uniref:hypothetical protein n=1 Tax=Bosea sp. (in: a-proteobacteria) TaxID=1871050 RepID=UPI002DDD8B94|nr:hypothetical protein [Bosea sp. (in: a-proteobacteria)]HEV2554789.1 hypothetical protein [Bosea sp. (in: a-proteobacteria)]